MKTGSAMARVLMFYVNTDETLPNEPSAAEIYRVSNDDDVVIALMNDLHAHLDRMLFIGGSDAAELARLNSGEYIPL